MVKQCINHIKHHVGTWQPAAFTAVASYRCRARLSLCLQPAEQREGENKTETGHT